MAEREQLRTLLDRLRASLQKLSENLDRLESGSQQLQASLLVFEELSAKETALFDRIQKLGLTKEKADLERGLARFPVDPSSAEALFSQEMRGLLPVWEGTGQTSQLRLNRLIPLPERLQQSMRQREAVLDRIRAAVDARVEEAERRTEKAAQEEEASSQFEVAPVSSEWVVAQTASAITLEVVLDEPHRVMPPLPSSDMPGLFVSTPTPPELGMPVHILCHLPMGRDVEADGFVAWRREGHNPEDSGFGIELAAIREEDRILLLDLLSH